MSIPSALCVPAIGCGALASKATWHLGWIGKEMSAEESDNLGGGHSEDTASYESQK